jgi:hypothetical protein
VSATYLPGEALSVTTHGRALEIDVRSHHDGGFLALLVEYYGPRFDGAEGFIGSSAYGRIEAERMFTFYLDPAQTTGA